MKNKLISGFLVILTSCILCPAIVKASDNNSWSQKFNLSPLNESIDQIGIWWIAFSKFETPAFSNFSLPNWSNINTSNTNAFAYSFTAASAVNFDLFFNSFEGSGQQADFLLLSSLGQTIKTRNHAKHVQYTPDLWGWQITNVDENTWKAYGGGDPLKFDFAPEPASFLLYGLGAAALGIFKRKKK